MTPRVPPAAAACWRGGPLDLEVAEVLETLTPDLERGHVPVGDAGSGGHVPVGGQGCDPLHGDRGGLPGGLLRPALLQSLPRPLPTL